MPYASAEAYQKKKKAEKEIDEDWSEWAGWNTSRFMYLLYWRVFPLTSHSYMNLVGGLLGMRGIVPALEYTVATFIGVAPAYPFTALHPTIGSPCSPKIRCC